MAWTASTSWERWDPNQYVICPYDVSHRILAKRFPTHLIKCRKNHQDKDFVSCPFNASHQILRPHLKSHISSCPDKSLVEPCFNGFNTDNHLKGDTSLPSCNSANLQFESDENWDEEIMENCSESFSSWNAAGNTSSCQNRSLLPYTRDELKRQSKLKALSEEVNQKWRTNNECRRLGTTQSQSSDSDHNGARVAYSEASSFDNRIYSSGQTLGHSDVPNYPGNHVTLWRPPNSLQQRSPTIKGRSLHNTSLEAGEQDL